MKNSKLDRTSFSIVKHEDQEKEEKTYWHDKTSIERLNALELTRQMIYGYDPVTTRLQRVLEIVRRTSC